VHDVLANGYPGPLDVMVVADADVETAARAEHAGATVVTADDRLGKAQAINLGFSKVTSPIVILTDANNLLSHGAIAALVRHFDDPRVGAVAGEKVEADGGGEDLYWRFESWLKQHEWRLGTTIGLVGELAAVRTDAWRPIPLDIATDDLWIALDLSERGYAVAYEPSAKAFEPPVHTFRQQWERRTRSVSAGLHVFQRRRSQLGPKGGLVSAEIWGHRLARYTVSPVAHAALVGVALRRARSSRLAQLFLIGHGIGAVAVARRAASDAVSEKVSAAAAERSRAAAAETSRQALTRDGDDADADADADASPSSAAALARRVTQALGQGVFLQAVALAGIARYLRGDRPTRWTTVRR
jgi:hypothetical protein